MSDYPVTNGRSSNYPVKNSGAHFVGSRATFCEPADLPSMGANVLAIPQLPFTVLSSSPVSVGPEFFGSHVYYRANDALLPATYKTVRNQDMNGGKSRWSVIQPTSTTWDWTDMDAWVNAHYARHRDIIHQLWGTPTWASARKTEVGIYGPASLGASAEPLDMADWSAFCTALATRYVGKIKYYEIWNEPNINNDGTNLPGVTTSNYFTGTWAKLSEMTRRANQAIKAVDPTAKIICANTQGWAATAGTTDTYFTGMMSAPTGDGSTTMKDWVDIIGVHLYLPTSNKVQDLAGMIDRINACKTTAGVSGLPTWDTESSMISSQASAYLDPKVCAHIARFQLTLAAKGIARTLWYQWDRDELDGYGYKNRAVVGAYHSAVRDLLMSGTIQSVSRLADGQVLYTTAGAQYIL